MSMQNPGKSPEERSGKGYKASLIRATRARVVAVAARLTGLKRVTGRQPKRLVASFAGVVMAILSMVLALLLAPSASATPTYAAVSSHEAASAAANNPSYWGQGCTKIEDPGGSSYVLAEDYSRVIVKAGSGEFANTVFDQPSAGQTVWADTNGDNAYNPGGQDGDKQISHIILCGSSTSSSTSSSATSSSSSSESSTESSSSTTQPTPPFEVKKVSASCAAEGYDVSATVQWAPLATFVVQDLDNADIGAFVRTDSSGKASFEIEVPGKDRIRVHGVYAEAGLEVDLQVNYPTCAPKTSERPTSSKSTPLSTKPGTSSSKTSASSSSSSSKAPMTSASHPAKPTHKSSTASSEKVTLIPPISKSAGHTSSTAAVVVANSSSPSQLGPVPHTGAVAHNDNGTNVVLFAALGLILLAGAGVGVSAYRRRSRA